MTNKLLEELAWVLHKEDAEYKTGVVSWENYLPAAQAILDYLPPFIVLDADEPPQEGDFIMYKSQWSENGSCGDVTGFGYYPCRHRGEIIEFKILTRNGTPVLTRKEG